MRRKIIMWMAAMLLLFLGAAPVHAAAAERQTIYNSPYVTFSPDQHAWTTNAGDTRYTWYPQGETILTGIPSSLRKLEAGEHYYIYSREGTVPVGKWVVQHPYASCIHDNYPTGYYHGILYGTVKCLRYYYSGWFSYCADCGGNLNRFLIYMSRDAAESLDYLEMRYDLDYYYLCPHCKNIEMGIPMGAHMCKAVSWNRYKVMYNPNTTEIYGGYMTPSTHMYNNATEYEGNTVTPVKRLSSNAYTRIGYEFVEWNTKPDGSGTPYEDGAEIWNLTEENEGVVTLYAQWRASRSTLRIEPNGGSYQGSREAATVEGDYGSAWTADMSSLSAPAGYRVSFAVNGGRNIEPLIGTMHFAEWRMEQPFLGKLSANTYWFTAPDGNVDTITAMYEAAPVTLPAAERSGYSFGGWYYDSGFTQAAGKAGDTIVPSRDLTLYAQWVDLVLVSEDNYEVNDGKGAVDLSWSQSDGKDKIYLVYQSRDGENWTRIHDAKDTGESGSVNLTFESAGQSQQYTVPYAGRYILTAQGAQGGSYGSWMGGAGGSVTASFWLTKGEVLTCTLGGQNGYNGGGTATDYGNGGGGTMISSDKKGVLLIAGGGGGASANGSGGAGGSSAGVIDASVGQDGMAGGGGGFQGGAAGEYITHWHNTLSSCYHSHKGSPETGGDCYGTRIVHSEPRVCQPRYALINTVYWEHGVGCGGLVTMYHYGWFGSSGCPVDHQTTKHSFCEFCGELPVMGNVPVSHTFTYTSTEYKLSCELPAGYFCGYTDGQIISSKPAYGGSSYVNTDYAENYVLQAGVRSGDGMAGIISQTVGFVETLDMKGVTALDLAAPDAVSRDVETFALSDTRVQIMWSEPADNGTEYFHVVESFLNETEVPLCRSNVTSNTMVSGVAGYYYLTDDSALTEVTATNSQYTEERTGILEFDYAAPDQRKYMHVAAVDVAGNLSGTTHISVESGSGDVAWPMYTEPLELESGENVFCGEDGIWYVKSDGVTPFTLNYQAYMEGPASLEYQPNYVIFASVADGNAAQNIIYIPSHEIRASQIRTEAEGLTYSQQGNSLLELYPYSVTIRSNSNRQLNSVQKFVLSRESSGTRIGIFPVVGADNGDKVVYSDPDRDRQNGILIIADGEAPVIRGMDVLENRELIDRRSGILNLTVSAVDELSGVRDLYVAIVNTDNAVEKIYRPDEDGCIRIEITQDEPIFSGDFSVTAHAVDNVGNVAEVVCGTTEFALETRVERILEPHEPVFKSGESGILSISVWGYADYVEVEFAETMTALNPELNKTYIYSDMPAYHQEERLQFMIPLETPANQSYIITVRAYKGDKKLEEYPAFGVVQVNGTVLDEFRTRLR